MKQITTQTGLEENPKITEKPTSLIPSNTTVFTKERIEQLEIYQTSMRKELERYDSWSYVIKVYTNRAKEGLKYFLMKKLRVLLETKLLNY